MRQNHEYQLARAIAQYMQLQYPKAKFRFDQAGLNLSKAQAGMNKAIQCGRGWPDFFLAEPRGDNPGLFLEIKRDGTRIYKKDGTFTDEHIFEQFWTLRHLREKGYKAEFSIGFDEFKAIVDKYMQQLPHEIRIPI